MRIEGLAQRVVENEQGGENHGFPPGWSVGDEWVFALMCADVMGFAALKPKGARAIGRVGMPLHALAESLCPIGSMTRRHQDEFRH
jgi:hypothetical protein